LGAAHLFRCAASFAQRRRGRCSPPARAALSSDVKRARSPNHHPRLRPTYMGQPQLSGSLVQYKVMIIRRSATGAARSSASSGTSNVRIASSCSATPLTSPSRMNMAAFPYRGGLVGGNA
jgi:hypothetical protein